MTELRVVTYNVRSMRDDVDALASVLRAQSADVVALQELPRFFRWRSACARLARLSGLVYVAGGRPTTGPGIFVAQGVAVTGVRVARLTTDKGLHSRGVAVAQLVVNGRPVSVASVHLGLDADQRVRHAAEVLALIGDFDNAIVAGDLNEPPGSPAWRAFEDVGLRDAHVIEPVGESLTFPARAPRRRLDAIWVGPAYDVRGCGVTVGAASADLAVRATDHLPVVAELALR